jgi:hypothetical protein
MFRRSFSASCLLYVAPSAYAAHPKRAVQIILVDTGKTVAVPVGQELVVSLPLLHYDDDYWYLASSTGGGLNLIGEPVQRRPRNWTPWGYSRQEFHFRRQAPGPVHLVFERSYYSKPMVLEVVDPQTAR